MAQPQQVIDPNVNPPPTEQELLEYRVAMDRLTSTFREEVQVRGVNAYTKLIHDLKITVCKFNSDLVEADEQAVLKSIKRHDGQHFKQGFVVKVRATSSREHHPDFSAAQYDREVYSAICKLTPWTQQTCPARWQISTTTWLSSKQRSANPISLKSVCPSHCH